MSILINWIITALAILLTAYILPGIFVASLYTAFIVALLLGLLNLLVKPILIVLTLPLNIITLGLFTFVINAGLLWFLTTIVKGFSVDGFLTALIGAALISVFAWGGNALFSNNT